MQGDSVYANDSSTRAAIELRTFKIMSCKEAFIQQLENQFGQFSSEPLQNLISDNLLSPFAISLPKSVLEQAQKSIELFFLLREKTSYINHYGPALKEKQIQDPGNKSIMMSYDFHVDENHNLKLIEINTNAAFLILGHQMYAAQKHPLPISDFSLNEIADCIRNEMRLQQKTVPDQVRLAIVDEKPSEQRLFIEFLVYNEFFKSLGWDSRILDIEDVFKDFKPDFIYNRYTDFFLSEPASQMLKRKYLQKEVCLSPHPFEYFLLADKQRMIDWREPGFLEKHGISGNAKELLLSVLPLAYDVCPDNAGKIWNERKKLFFKPKNAFGSKQSYRGSSISRRAFDEMLNQDMIAQEYIPAPELEFNTPEGPQKFKYDLRCYAYQGRLQMIVARLYQGQVTNLRTPYGGFACVLFT